MIIKESEVRLRDRGYNLGMPMIHFSLDGASGPPTRQLVTDIVTQTLSRNTKSRWVCLETGEDGIPSGIGSLLNGLVSCGLEVDLHIHFPRIAGSSSTSPSWLTKPDTIVVDFDRMGDLNYNALKKSDVISFEQPEEDLTDVFSMLKFCPATKWIVTDNEDYVSLVEESERSGLIWVS